MEYLSLTIELIAGYFALLAATKIMGRTSLSEATPFDFVAAIVLGEFVGNAVYDSEVDIWRILFAVALWAVLILAIDLITMKFHVTRNLFESRPSLLIKNGVIDRKEMKKRRMDINRLQTLLRDKEVFSFREIEYAIYEPNGKVTVLKKPMYQNIVRSDMNLPSQSKMLPLLLISDGVLITRNLLQMGQDEHWLLNELNQRGINAITDVMLAEWSQEDGLFVQKLDNA